MKREPLLKKGLWTALAGAVFALALVLGSPIPLEVQTAILGLIGAVLPIIAAVWARQDVTPVEDPRDADGEPLVPLPEAA